METQNYINIGFVLLMITGFTTVIVYDDNGIELEPTHYCETTYPYTIKEEGVSLNKEIDLLRQAVFELNERIKILENAK